VKREIENKKPRPNGRGNKRAKGVEPSTKPNNSSGNTTISETGGVKASPLPSLPFPTDEDFLAVALAWPTLPKAIKFGILAIVQATK